MLTYEAYTNLINEGRNRNLNLKFKLRTKNRKFELWVSSDNKWTLGKNFKTQAIYDYESYDIYYYKFGYDRQHPSDPEYINGVIGDIDDAIDMVNQFGLNLR